MDETMAGESRADQSTTDPSQGQDAALARAREDELLDLFLGSADLATFLARVAVLAAEDLSRAEAPGAVACSVTVDRKGRRGTVASSSPIAESMDELQYASGDGPCSEAVRTGRTVYVPDVTTTERYPRYREAVGAAPLRSVFATPIPLPTSAGADAALNCYSTEPDGFTDELRARAEEIASLASRSVHLAVRFARESERAADLEAALDSRTAINLATGVIMAQSNCSAEDAVGLLKTASMNRNQKLRDVAALVLSRYGSADPATYFS
jgi:GAF domain-containing protein